MNVWFQAKFAGFRHFAFDLGRVVWTNKQLVYMKYKLDKKKLKQIICLGANIKTSLCLGFRFRAL